MGGEDYDVFLSYAHQDDGDDDGPVSELYRALCDKELKVFFDREEIPDFASISERLETGLARSKVLVAWYSTIYPTRPVCRWELTAGYLAAAAVGKAAERVLVVSPEHGEGGSPRVDHIQPQTLRDQAIASASDAQGMVAAISSAVDTAGNRFGDIGLVRHVEHFGRHLMPNEAFVGRDDVLWDLHGELHRGQQVVLTPGAVSPGVALRGGGGMGKTMAAEEYSLRFAAAHPGGVCWLQGAGPDEGEIEPDERRRRREDARRDLANRLGAQLPPDVESSRIEAALADRLDQRIADHGPLLWIVDDLSGDLAQDEVRAWLPPGNRERVRTLMTSRSPIHGLAEIGVAELEPDAAFRLLTGRNPPADAAELTAAQTIVEELGRHALALDVAGAYVDRLPGPTRYRAFLEQLLADEDDPDVIEAAAQLKGELHTGHDKSVASTLLRSLELLSDEARPLLHLAAVAGPAPLPMELTTAALETMASVPNLVIALEEIEHHSLASAVDDRRSWTTHALVRRVVARSWAATDQLDGARSALREGLSNTLPEVVDARAHDRLAGDVDHARHLVATDHDDEVLTLTGWLARLDGERGRAREATEGFERQLEARTRIRGPDHPETLTTRNNLAFWLGDAGRVDDAIEQFTTLLDDSTRILGPDHPDTLTTRNNLAFWLGDAGRVDDAIEQFTTLLDDRTRILGPDHPDTLTTRNNLAFWLGEAGRVDDAIEQFTTLLDDRTRILGPDHPDTLGTRHNLAFWLGEAGRVDDAIEQFTTLLDDRTRILGPDHPDTLGTRHNLAFWLGEAGRVDDAIEQFTTLLDDRTRILGPDHPDTLGTRHNLASWLGEAGRVDDAIEQLTTLLDDQTRILGPDHPDTLGTRHNLASWLGRAGRVDDAIEQLTTLLDDQTRILGPDHPDTLGTRHNLASWLGRAGRVDDAIEQLTTLLDDQTRILGPDHPNTLGTRHNLASWLGRAGRVDNAIEQLTTLLDDQTRILGPDHPNTLGTRHNLASWLGRAGRVDDAIEQLTTLLDDQTRILGPDHPNTLGTRHNLASWLGRAGRVDNAIEQLTTLLDDQTRILGPDHPNTLGTRNNLAYLARRGRARR